MNDQKKHLYNHHREQGLTNFLCKGPDENVLGFADNTDSVTTAEFSCSKSSDRQSKQKDMDVFQ